MKTKVKECCNSNCTNTFYVEDYELCLPLICMDCQDKDC